MSVTIEQVPLWVRQCGISHAVWENLRGIYTTACGSLMTGNEHTDRPKRVCSKCRKRLREATLI